MPFGRLPVNTVSLLHLVAEFTTRCRLDTRCRFWLFLVPPHTSSWNFMYTKTILQIYIPALCFVTTNLLNSIIKYNKKKCKLCVRIQIRREMKICSKLGNCFANKRPPLRGKILFGDISMYILYHIYCLNVFISV